MQDQRDQSPKSVVRVVGEDRTSKDSQQQQHASAPNHTQTYPCSFLPPHRIRSFFFFSFLSVSPPPALLPSCTPYDVHDHSVCKADTTRGETRIQPFCAFLRQGVHSVLRTTRGQGRRRRSGKKIAKNDKTVHGREASNELGRALCVLSSQVFVDLRERLSMVTVNKREHWGLQQIK